jgi:hypothetical protein
MRLVDTSGQLDRDTEHQLLRRPIDTECHLTMERGLRAKCLSDGTDVLGCHAYLYEREYIWGRVFGFDQQDLHLLDFRERFDHFDYGVEYGRQKEEC